MMPGPATQLWPDQIISNVIFSWFFTETKWNWIHIKCIYESKENQTAPSPENLMNAIIPEEGAKAKYEWRTSSACS